MAELVDDLSELPRGSHCLSLHSSRGEGAQHAADFLAGTPPGQAASYWVVDSEVQREYRSAVQERAPLHVGCIAVLPHSQVELANTRLRPAAEVREFLRDHPSGVTASGETITHYWTRDSVPDHLEYETWFHAQGRDDSRFLCPYDLREIPPDLAPMVLRSLGAHHSHVMLTVSDEPGVRLLELFVFPHVEEIPEPLDATLGWAIKKGFVRLLESARELELSPEGDEVIRRWSEAAVIA
jgi:hypothetical protein